MVRGTVKNPTQCVLYIWLDSFVQETCVHSHVEKACRVDAVELD